MSVKLLKALALNMISVLVVSSYSFTKYCYIRAELAGTTNFIIF